MSALSLALRPQLPEFDIHKALRHIQGIGDWNAVRFYSEISSSRQVRNEKPEANHSQIDRGAMVEVLFNGQIAYAGTSDLSLNGIKKAAERALALAKASHQQKVFPLSVEQRTKSTGRYHSPRRMGLDQVTLAEFTDLLLKCSKHLKVSEQIVTASAEANLIETHIQYASSNGSDIDQDFLLVTNNFAVTAQQGTESQRRSMNGPVARCAQAGLELFDQDRLFSECDRVGRQAVELLRGEPCPNEILDLILAPDQMLLQIHESIGHPLELDRILGDERNYAGWSFVKASDFGKLQYGSPLMNVTFDPTFPGEFASYAFDDGGAHATKEYLIKEGLLLKGLGGAESQARIGMPGVANFRAASWNRAPIDRMANINLEPGEQSLSEMIASVERGVYMQSNISWSIDDYRNKFQFGCEYAQLIEDGRLTKILKNPNYRGVTVPFWNSLKSVGRREEREVFGSPYCGKGEPSQVIRVGHASPPCLFAKIEVFGGGK